MKKSLLKIFLSALIIFISIGASFALVKPKYTLVLFYADWNVYSERAINTLQEVATLSNKINFEKINMDDSKAFIRMKELGVMPTNSIPYYFLIDKKHDKVLYGSTYKKENAKVILNNLNKKIEQE